MAQTNTAQPRALILGDPKGGTVLLPVNRKGRGASRRRLIAKTCLGCGILRDAANYPPTGKGGTRRAPHCHKCHAERVRAHRQATR